MDRFPVGFAPAFLMGTGKNQGQHKRWERNVRAQQYGVAELGKLYLS